MKWIAVLALVSACSWALIQPPPRHDPGLRPLDCTTGNAAPIADSVLAALTFGGAVALFIASQPDEGDAPRTGVAPAGILLGIPLVLWGIPHAFSALYGYTTTARCRRMNRQVVPM